MNDPTEPGWPIPETGPTGMPDALWPTVPYTPPLIASDSPQATGARHMAGAPQTADALRTAESLMVTSGAAPPRRRRGGLVAMVALIVVGLVAVLGGGAALGRELTRKATKAEQAAALATEIVSRWQRLPAGKIFPATISYLSADGDKATAIRVGIEPQTSCKAALEPTTFQVLRALGCVAMLRATYIDAAGTQAATVGIAVMSSTAAAERAQGDLSPLLGGAGLYAVPVTGTIADMFGNTQRSQAATENAGPYLLLYTAGYTDGRPGAEANSDQLGELGAGILTALVPTLIRHTSACTMKDIKC